MKHSRRNSILARLFSGLLALSLLSAVAMAADAEEAVSTKVEEESAELSKNIEISTETAEQRSEAPVRYETEQGQEGEPDTPTAAAPVSDIQAVISITEQPRDVTGIAGKTVDFHTGVSGSGATYQWQYKKPAGSWTNLGSFAGYNTDTLTVPVTQARNGYLYHCVITAGNTTLTTRDAVLTVFAITVQPANVTAGEGTNVHFSVTARGSGVTYQWQYKKPAGNWTNLGSFAGYNTDTLTVPVTAARHGYQYHCLVSCQGSTVTSADAVLTVTSGPAITEQPRDVTGISGKTVNFHVGVTGSGVAYQWQYQKPAGSWTNLGSFTGYNTATLTVPVTAARNGYKYRCVITAGGLTVTSNDATLTVFAITAQPEDVIGAVGGTVSFHTSARGSGVTYQWQYKKPTGNWTNLGSFAGYNTETLTVPVTMTRNGYLYRCRVTCGGTTLTSDTAVLTVVAEAEPITVTAQPRDCYVNALGDTAWAQVTAQGNDLTYRWYYRDPGSADFTADDNRTDTYTVEMTAARKGRQVYCEIRNLTGTTVRTDTVTLSAVPTAVITVPLLPAQVKNDTVALQVSVSGDGLVYSWYYREANMTFWYLDGCAGNTYRMTVTQSNSGRQVFCAVRDQYGNTIRTNTVKILASGNIVLPEVP